MKKLALASLLLMGLSFIGEAESIFFATPYFGIGTGYYGYPYYGGYYGYRPYYGGYYGYRGGWGPGRWRGGWYRW